MRYLFFDIECSDGRHICEFGYVITDDKFNVTEKKYMTINPEKKFRLKGRRHDKDIELYFDEKKYYQSPKFPFYYNTIKNLIESKDVLIIGHAISNDAVFLNTACQRYNLDPINFKFADSQKIFSEFSNLKNHVSLEETQQFLSLEKPKYLHKSDEDSLTTMLLVKSICDTLDCQLQDLIDLCESATGTNQDGQWKYDDSEKRMLQRYEKSLNTINNKIKGFNYKMFLRFLEGVKPQVDIIESMLTNKSICISKNYEYLNFRQMLALVQLITNHGGKYSLKSSENDLFVKYQEFDNEGNIKYCSREKYVLEAIQNGKQIDFISFNDLLDILKVNESMLLEFPFPKMEDFVARPSSKKNKNKSSVKMENETSSSTIGDMLFARGFDLSSLIKEDLIKIV